MRSPFPGMDPYFEQHWRDVHHRLCTYAGDALQPQIRPALVARIEERLIVETDARVTSEIPNEGFITIIDPTTGGKLTVIEFLSTSNKLPGKSQREYLQKRDELLEAEVSIVEIDLLRDGAWILPIPISSVPATHRTPYRACVHRGWKYDEFALYAIRLDQRLPAIPIPLRQQDKEAVLDLQALIDQTYWNGAYDFIDYSKLPVPPLASDDAAWAQQAIRERSRD